MLMRWALWYHHHIPLRLLHTLKCGSFIIRMGRECLLQRVVGGVEGALKCIHKITTQTSQ